MFTDRSALPEKPIRISKFRKLYPDLPINPEIPIYQDPETGLRMGAIHWILKAGIIRRIIAHLLDLALLAGFLYGMLTVGKYLVATYPSYERMIGISFIVIIVVFVLLYFILWEGFFGKSLGKLIFGMRVVNHYGKRPGIWKTIVRHLMRLIDTPVIATIIFVALVYDFRSKQRLGDVVAKTYVVRV